MKAEVALPLLLLLCVVEDTVGWPCWSWRCIRRNLCKAGCIAGASAASCSTGAGCVAVAVALAACKEGCDRAFSDLRLKKNIRDKPTELSVLGLHTVEWEWNDLAKQLYNLTGTEDGVVGNELFFAYPQAVSLDPLGYFMVDYGYLYGLVENNVTASGNPNLLRREIVQTVQATQTILEVTGGLQSKEAVAGLLGGLAGLVALTLASLAVNVVVLVRWWRRGRASSSASKAGPRATCPPHGTPSGKPSTTNGFGEATATDEISSASSATADSFPTAVVVK